MANTGIEHEDWMINQPYKNAERFLAEKPQWYEAPFWANYLAMMPTGQWVWFQEKPHKVQFGWMRRIHTKMMCERITYRNEERGLTYTVRWDVWPATLEERPEGY